jgi:hypothetical protein
MDLQDLFWIFKFMRLWLEELLFLLKVKEQLTDLLVLLFNQETLILFALL